VSGSISSSVGARPARAAPNAGPTAMAPQKARRNVSTSFPPGVGGEASVTSWPSDASSVAACSSASRASGSGAMPGSLSVLTAIRRRPAGRWTAMP
jgi:hypothetical protein